MSHTSGQTSTTRVPRGRPSRTPQIEECIEACLRCHQTCLDDAMNHCLERGGRHTDPEHFRLMITCAEICRTAAGLMMAGSRHHESLCRVCAEVCDDCARSCDELDDMQDCAAVCRECAEACRRMSMH